jgi:hypothetical protein
MKDRATLSRELTLVLFGPPDALPEGRFRRDRILAEVRKAAAARTPAPTGEPAPDDPSGSDEEGSR